MKGFTLIEFLVAVAIIVIVAVLILVPLWRTREANALSISADQVMALIEDARGRTLSAKDDSHWGVHFQTDKAALFKGSTYVQGAADNREIELDERVQISSINLDGGGDDLVFKRLSGETDQDGAVTLSLKSDGSQTKVITIQSSGIAELED